jgi:hypothetical protein
MSRGIYSLFSNYLERVGRSSLHRSEKNTVFELFEAIQQFEGESTPSE